MKSSTGAPAQHLIAVLAGTLLGLAACATTKPPSQAVVAEEPAPPPEPASQADAAPKLVVLIVMDQLGAWVLDEHLPSLPKGGAIRRAHREGAVHMADYPFASTQTAPGHASLTTGVTPAVHGIVSNAVYDADLGSRRTVDDRKHAVIGNPARFVSPMLLRSETVADALHNASGGKARIVGISMRDRTGYIIAAILTALYLMQYIKRQLTRSHDDRLLRK